MKLYIKSDEGYKLNFWLPTSLIKSKLLCKALFQNKGVNIDAAINITPYLYKNIKKYIKKQGHFILVEIQSVEGYNITIKV